MTTRVLVVDDSALMRAVLVEVINAAPDLHVAGTACNALEAREFIKTLNPDVMTLDVDMPHMDGLEFLAQVMRLRPMPVVMVSGLTEKDSETTLRALELGAVDFVSKPRTDPVGNIHAYADQICEKIRAAALSRKHLGQVPSQLRSPVLSSIPGAPLTAKVLQEKLVLIGASTGGTEAIREVLIRFPERMPGILIVQHMPEMFTTSFARRLDGLCSLHVKEAEHGERVKPGVVYLAPGHSHLMVRRVSGGFQCELSRENPVNRHRPSVEVLFNSAAAQVGRSGVGVMLTGMGKDGAQAMLNMREAGSYNICQDQESSVVWGMPREATINGAAHEVASLREIAGRVMHSLRGV
ncbi:chemotaxis response regulator protein-glutamate methylesterase [Uliginosibacterium sp. 31-16]|uniref:protein-glutamate methylesterase/protein-glutamine glutaminase n=1 Tax=Uliginosibacterium sp. 31-16 TaxID=3068315 RepID=UPI00273D4C3D|nr:chemotaxis response regulator protein-glutamate methylesterase [Uliginosibacterium sp. 31-16]MDP5240290.1 chemotaxis response regulator protein-glutamate methylesterase [Uliginosibacterium sp. 31-16]